MSRAARERRDARPAAAGEDLATFLAARPDRFEVDVAQNVTLRGGHAPQTWRRDAEARADARLARLLEPGPVAIQRLCEDAADLRDALQGSLPSYVRNCGRYAVERRWDGRARVAPRREDRYAALQRVVEGAVASVCEAVGLAPTAAHVEDVVGSRSKLDRFLEGGGARAPPALRALADAYRDRDVASIRSLCSGCPFRDWLNRRHGPFRTDAAGVVQRRAPERRDDAMETAVALACAELLPAGHARRPRPARAPSTQTRPPRAGVDRRRARREPAGRAAVRQHQRRAARPALPAVGGRGPATEFRDAPGVLRPAARRVPEAVVRPLRRGRGQLRGRLRRAAAVRGRRGTPAIGRRPAAVALAAAALALALALALAAAAPVAVAAWGVRPAARARLRPAPRAAAGAGAARLRPVPRAAAGAGVAARAGPVAARLRPAGVHGRVGVLLPVRQRGARLLGLHGAARAGAQNPVQPHARRGPVPLRQQVQLRARRGAAPFAGDGRGKGGGGGHAGEALRRAAAGDRWLGVAPRAAARTERLGRAARAGADGLGRAGPRSLPAGAGPEGLGAVRRARARVGPRRAPMSDASPKCVYSVVEIPTCTNMIRPVEKQQSERRAPFERRDPKVSARSKCSFPHCRYNFYFLKKRGHHDGLLRGGIYIYRRARFSRPGPGTELDSEVTI